MKEILNAEAISENKKIQELIEHTSEVLDLELKQKINFSLEKLRDDAEMEKEVVYEHFYNQQDP